VFFLYFFFGGGGGGRNSTGNKHSTIRLDRHSPGGILFLVFEEGIVQEASFVLFFRERTVQLVFYLFGEETFQETSLLHVSKVPDRLNLVVKEQTKNYHMLLCVCIS
jgi:hypothetical protein